MYRQTILRKTILFQTGLFIYFWVLGSVGELDAQEKREKVGLPYFLTTVYSAHTAQELREFVLKYSELEKRGAELSESESDETIWDSLLIDLGIGVEGKLKRSYETKKTELLDQIPALVQKLSLPELAFILRTFYDPSVSIRRDSKYTNKEIAVEFQKACEVRWFGLNGETDPELYAQIFWLAQKTQRLNVLHIQDQLRTFEQRSEKSQPYRSDFEGNSHSFRTAFALHLEKSLKTFEKRVKQQNSFNLKLLYSWTEDLIKKSEGRDKSIVLPFAAVALIYEEAMEWALNARNHPMDNLLGTKDFFQSPDKLELVGVEELGYLSHPDSVLFLHDIAVLGSVKTPSGELVREYPMPSRIKAIESLGNLGLLTPFVLGKDAQTFMKWMMGKKVDPIWKTEGTRLFGSETAYVSKIDECIKRIRTLALPKEYTMERYKAAQDAQYPRRLWTFLPDVAYFLTTCLGYDEDPKIRAAKCEMNVKTWGTAIIGRFVAGTFGFLVHEGGEALKIPYTFIADPREEETWQILQWGPRGWADAWFDLIPLTLITQGSTGVWKGGRIGISRLRNWWRETGRYKTIEDFPRSFPGRSFDPASLSDGLDLHSGSYQDVLMQLRKPQSSSSAPSWSSVPGYGLPLSNRTVPVVKNLPTLIQTPRLSNFYPSKVTPNIVQGLSLGMTPSRGVVEPSMETKSKPVEVDPLYRFSSVQPNPSRTISLDRDKKWRSGYAWSSLASEEEPQGKSLQDWLRSWLISDPNHKIEPPFINPFVIHNSSSPQDGENNGNQPSGKSSRTPPKDDLKSLLGHLDEEVLFAKMLEQLSQVMAPEDLLSKIIREIWLPVVLNARVTGQNISNVEFGTFSDLTKLMQKSGLWGSALDQFVHGLNLYKALPLKGDLLSQTVHELLGASFDISRLIVVVLPSNAQFYESVEALHQAPPNLPFNVVAFEKGNQLEALSHPLATINIKPFIPIRIPSIILLRAHKHNELNMFLIRDVLHEARHFADIEFLSRWIEANQTLISYGEPSDSLYSNPNMIHTTNDVVELNESFHRAFLESRAYRVVSESFHALVYTLNVAPAAQKLGTVGEIERQARENAMNAVAEVDPNEGMIQFLNLRTDNIFEIGMQLGETMRQTIERAHKLLAEKGLRPLLKNRLLIEGIAKNEIVGETRMFPIQNILRVTTGLSISKDFHGVNFLLNFLTGKAIASKKDADTAMLDARIALYRQYPELANVDTSTLHDHNVNDWVQDLSERFNAGTLEVVSKIEK